MGHHGLRRATHFVGGQPQLLLGGEYRANGRRIGIAVHEVIDEPLGFLGAQVVPSDQLGEDRLPCDFGHDALLGAVARLYCCSDAANCNDWTFPHVRTSISRNGPSKILQKRKPPPITVGGGYVMSKSATQRITARSGHGTSCTYDRNRTGTGRSCRFPGRCGHPPTGSAAPRSSDACWPEPCLRRG